MGTSQAGFSAMVILIIVVLVIAISWEVSVYMDRFFSGANLSSVSNQICPTGIPGECNPDEGLGPVTGSTPICKSGNPNDCNDSQDITVFNE